MYLLIKNIAYYAVCPRVQLDTENNNFYTEVELLCIETMLQLK